VIRKKNSGWITLFVAAPQGRQSQQFSGGPPSEIHARCDVGETGVPSPIYPQGRTKMATQSIKTALVTGIASIACGLMLGSADLAAQKKGGGKPKATGLIYFNYDGDVWTMDGNGKNKKQLHPNVRGYPSYRRYAGLRWFLTVENGELVAIHEADELDPEPGEVSITQWGDGVTVEGGPRWLKDDPTTGNMDEADTYCSFLGLDDVSGAYGVYKAQINWTNNEPAIIGAPVLVAAEAEIPDNSLPLMGHDWHPDGETLVLDVYSGGYGFGSLYIKEPNTTPTFLATAARIPGWSPDGSKIAFQGHDTWSTVETISPNGEDRQVLVSGRGGGNGAYVSGSHWDPTTGFLLYKKGPSTDVSKLEPHIYRMTSTGGGSTNLTNDDPRIQTGFYGPYIGIIAWRE
jgi:hypothetical protein